MLGHKAKDVESDVGCELEYWDGGCGGPWRKYSDEGPRPGVGLWETTACMVCRGNSGTGTKPFSTI